jgi:hypothetical protein
MTETGGTALREDFEAEKSRYNRNILRVQGKMPYSAGAIAQFGRGGTPNEPTLTGPADPLPIMIARFLSRATVDGWPGTVNIATSAIADLSV